MERKYKNVLAIADNQKEHQLPCKAYEHAHPSPFYLL